MGRFWSCRRRRGVKCDVILGRAFRRADPPSAPRPIVRVQRRGRRARARSRANNPRARRAAQRAGEAGRQRDVEAVKGGHDKYWDVYNDYYGNLYSNKIYQLNLIYINNDFYKNIIRL